MHTCTHRHTDTHSHHLYVHTIADSYFFRIVLSEPTSVQHLAPALMRFFVNMEETDYYEKGDKRRQVATIMQTLWKSDPHRAALIKDSTGPEFTRFIMLLINDTVRIERH